MPRKPSKKKVPIVEQYTFFTNHLQYLDGKMTELFKLFITLATAIIGGTFLIYLKPPLEQDIKFPLFAFGADFLLIVVGSSICFCILNRLRSWGGYRKRLVELYDTGEVAARPLIGEWWISEVVICVIIMSTVGAFPHINPLATGEMVPHWHRIQNVYWVSVILLIGYAAWLLYRLTSIKRASANQQDVISTETVVVKREVPRLQERILFSLLLPILVTVITAYFLNWNDEGRKRNAALHLFEYDIELNTKHAEGTLANFLTIKSAAKLSLTPHHSYIFDVQKQNLYLLPENLLKTVIIYYTSLDSCEIRRQECQQAVEYCDAYEGSLGHSLEYGKTALQRIKDYKAE